MFGSKQDSSKTIERFLIDQIEGAVQDYDKSLPGKFFPKFSKKADKSVWLGLHPILIKGFRGAIATLAALKVGTVNTPAATADVYSIASTVVVKAFENYFEKTYSLESTDNKQGSILSLNLVDSINVPRKVKDEVGRMRHRIRASIFATAAFIEANQFISVAQILDTESRNSVRQRAESFLDAQYKIRTSCTSISVSLELFKRSIVSINDRVKAAKAHRDTVSERKYLLLAAVFVYEVLDLMASFLKAFEIQGVEELKRIHIQVKSEIETGINNNDKIKGRANEIITRIGGTELDDSSLLADQRNDALHELEKIWDVLMRNISMVEDSVGRFRERIDVIEIKRDEAAENIRIFAITEVTSKIVDNSKAVEAVLNMKLPELPPITVADIRRYFPNV